MWGVCISLVPKGAFVAPTRAPLGPDLVMKPGPTSSVERVTYSFTRLNFRFMLVSANPPPYGPIGSVSFFFTSYIGTHIPPDAETCLQ